MKWIYIDCFITYIILIVYYPFQIIICFIINDGICFLCEKNQDLNYFILVCKYCNQKYCSNCFFIEKHTSSCQ
jgi:hypothetical protein